MLNSHKAKSSFMRKSSPLAWTLCFSFTPCQYIHILQASDSDSSYTPLSHARGPHVLIGEVRPRRACRSHLSRISQDISHQHQWFIYLRAHHSRSKRIDGCLITSWIGHGIKDRLIGIEAGLWCKRDMALPSLFLWPKMSVLHMLHMVLS